MANIGLEHRIDHMRTRVLVLMPDTCHVLETMHTIDEAGGWTNDEQVPVDYNGSPDIPCRVDPTRQYRQGDVFEQEVVISDFIITVPFDAPMLADYIIHVGDIDYEVKKLMDSHSWRVTKRAFVVRLN